MPAEAAPSFVWVPELAPAGGRLTLSEEESHYVARVCRARVGDRLSATDGRGGLATLRMLELRPRAVAEVESCERADPARTAWVMAGAPQGERGDWMVEKLAELGVGVFQPLDCERGRWVGTKGRTERWRRLAIAALRQSRRRFLLEVRTPIPFAEALAALPSDARRWVGDASGPSAASLAPPRAGVAVGLVGPGAGFSPAERTRIASLEFVLIALSDSRLRTETAALAWASWWSGAGPAAARVDRAGPGLDALTGRP